MSGEAVNRTTVRDILQAAAMPGVGPEELAERLKALREVVSGMDPDLQALARAASLVEEDPDRAVAFALMHFGEPRPPPDFDAVPVVRPSGTWRHEPLPAPVVWRDRGADGDESGAPAHCVVAVGEVAVLAGAGKGGKSYLAVGLGVAAAAAHGEGRAYGVTCGLRVLAGRVLIVSYEDAPKRIDERVSAMAGGPEDVNLVPHPPPIYGYDRGSGRWGPVGAWSVLWDAVRDAAPKLVVVDTAPKAMGGETNDPGAVIGFLAALEREARRGRFAILVLAHDTKASRDAARSGAELDAGAVAGSGQWHDSPRGVLHLAKMGPGDAPRLLECVKASYGPDGWGARLEVRYGATARYAGLALAEGGLLDEEGLREARREFRDARVSGVAEPARKGRVATWPKPK